jgi:hypothetical protein
MVKVQLVQGAMAAASPAGSQPPPATYLDVTHFSVDVGGSIEGVRAEIDDCFADMRTFHTREPDEIMRLCRGHSARLSELRVRIMRVEDWDRKWRSVRQREIEPTLDELREQWQNASRLHAVRELDWKMESGLT